MTGILIVRQNGATDADCRLADRLAICLNATIADENEQVRGAYVDHTAIILDYKDGMQESWLMKLARDYIAIHEFAKSHNRGIYATAPTHTIGE